MIGDRRGVVEGGHQPITCEQLDRAAIVDDELADHAVVFAQDTQHLFRLGTLRERGEAPKVGEERGDLATMTGQ